MMKVKEAATITVFIACLSTLALGLAGCVSSSGRIKGQSTGVGVSLGNKNYKLIKATAQGESTGFRLLGIIPFVAPTYADAKKKLYASVGTPLEGKAIALVNQTEDISSLYLVLFSIPKITLNADVIEYTK